MPKIILKNEHDRGYYSQDSIPSIKFQGFHSKKFSTRTPYQEIQYKDPIPRNSVQGSHTKEFSTRIPYQRIQYKDPILGNSSQGSHAKEFNTRIPYKGIQHKDPIPRVLSQTPYSRNSNGSFQGSNSNFSSTDRIPFQGSHTKYLFRAFYSN
jgi:hypothetical protein